MKKKLIKLTKMFLVLCLVVSELSSVGLVFAEGESTKFDSSINVSLETQYEPTITIKSNDLYEQIPSTKRGCKGQFETRVEQAVRTCNNVKNR